MSFSDILGQKKAKDILTGQMKSGRTPHAYLFIGPHGVGRKKTALELAKYLNCESRTGGKDSLPGPCDHCLSCGKISKLNHPDVQLIDFEYQARLENKDLDKQKVIKIDTIRALQKEVNLKPVEGRWKVFIVEPAEKISIDAANCLLKTLEEPPAWTVIILLAKHKENLPPTIVSRTQIVLFGPIPENDIAKLLIEKSSVEPETAREIAALSEGSISEAYVKLAGQSIEALEVWKSISSGTLSSAQLLFKSQQYSKNAGEFLNELLLAVKRDFRSNPKKHFKTLENIIASQKFLEKNANPQLVMDSLFLKLSKS